MRRLFSRKSVDDEKKEKFIDKPAKESRSKRSFFGKSSSTNGAIPKTASSSNSQPQNSSTHDSLTIQQNIDSSASSAVSIPPYTHTPSASSSFSSITSVTDSSFTPLSLSADITVPSLSRSPGSTQSLSSCSSGSVPSSRPSISPLSRPSSSSTGSKKATLSPLSTVVDPHNLPTPPPSPGDQEDLPKRRNSIYNIFRKSQSQPNLAQSASSSRSNSTTTLPSICTAPHMPPAELVPPAPTSNKRHSIFLRKRSSNSSLTDLTTAMGDEGILSRDQTTAHRAILMGDPLGGGAYLYPTARKTEQFGNGSPGRGGRRPSRKRPQSMGYQDNNAWRRNSWAGAQNVEGGAAWRKPRIGGGYGNRMVIEEETGEYQNQQGMDGGIGPGGYIEDGPQFNERRRPLSHAGPSGGPSRSNSGHSSYSGHGYYHAPQQRPAHYPPFAPPPLLPPISQYLEPPAVRA